MKAKRCELVIGTKENIVGGGTIIRDYGLNYIVIVDVPYESKAPLPISIPDQAATVGAAMGHQVLWPTHLVILSTKLIHVCSLHVLLHFIGGIYNLIS